MFFKQKGFCQVWNGSTEGQGAIPFQSTNAIKEEIYYWNNVLFITFAYSFEVNWEVELFF